MSRFSLKIIGDAVQIVASVGVIAVLVLMIVDAVRIAQPAPGHIRPAEPREVPAESTPPGPISAGRQQELKAFVHRRCTVCHGGEGSLGPVLSSIHLQPLSVNAVSLTILHGRPDRGMPAWEDQLSEADTLWLAGYLKGGGFAD